MSPERCAYLREMARDAAGDSGAGTDWGAPLDEALDELERMQAALRRQRRPEFVQFPPQFGHVWVNPFRVDSIEIKRGATKHVVTVRIREQRLQTLDTVSLTAEEAAEVVVNVLAMIRRGDG